MVFDTIAGAIEAGVRYLSLYTFSTENWKRSPQEVRFLMGFSRDIIHRRVDQMNEWGVRVRRCWAQRPLPSMITPTWRGTLFLGKSGIREGSEKGAAGMLSEV